jgi:hypothetical protein
MPYAVTCSECDLEETIDTLEAVLELREDHRREAGDHHVLEFELLDG